MDRLTRGDVVIVALQGDYGKPRPAVVVQSDLFNDAHASISVVPVTTTLVDSPLFRLTVEASSTNGLQTLSQLMVDKLTAVRRDRIDRAVGRVDDDLMLRVNRALALWLGLAA